MLKPSASAIPSRWLVFFLLRIHTKHGQTKELMTNLTNEQRQSTAVSGQPLKVFRFLIRLHAIIITSRKHNANNATSVKMSTQNIKHVSPTIDLPLTRNKFFFFQFIFQFGYTRCSCLVETCDDDDDCRTGAMPNEYCSALPTKYLIRRFIHVH